MPVAGALVALALPIMQVAAFGQATKAGGVGLLAMALATLATGLYTYSAFLLFARAYYALGDSRTPALVALIKLSSRDPSHSSENLPADLGSGLLSAGVRHVVVNTDSMPRDLHGALESRGFKLLAVEGRRELYQVRGK